MSSPRRCANGVNLADIQHAVMYALVVEDPIRHLVVGPDRAAIFQELVVLDRQQGPAMIHAMPMRARYRRLLPGGE